MSIFHKAENTQAKLKAGFMGFQGSGKTHTSTLIMIGLVARMKELGLELGDKPVFFLDSETGSDWVTPMFEGVGIELFVSKSQRFADLEPAIKEATQNGAGLIIDSATHYWRDLCESYQAKKAKRIGRSTTRCSSRIGRCSKAPTDGVASLVSSSTPICTSASVAVPATSTTWKRTKTAKRN